MKGINIETGDFCAIKQIEKELVQEDKLAGVLVRDPKINSEKFNEQILICINSAKRNSYVNSII